MTPKDIAEARKLMQTARWRIALHRRFGVVDGLCSEGRGEQADEPNFLKLGLWLKTGAENLKLIVWAMKHLPELVSVWEIHHEYLNSPISKLIQKSREDAIDECAEAAAIHVGDCCVHVTDVLSGLKHKSRPNVTRTPARKRRIRR